MKLLKLNIERYKGYAELAKVELAPLTILVGSNNSGKTALAQAIQLLAGGLAPSDKDNPEPLPLDSGGIRHGETFEDLVTGRTVHGWLGLSADLADDSGELSLSATVQNVVAPPRASERQITKWSLSSSSDDIVVTREGFDEQSPYLVSVSGKEQSLQQISWQGLLPRQPEKLSKWVAAQVDALRAWGSGVRYLRCPRSLRPSPFTMVGDSPKLLGGTSINSTQLRFGKTETGVGGEVTRKCECAIL